jgi:outer membrane autotransporter protein
MLFKKKLLTSSALVHSSTIGMADNVVSHSLPNRRIARNKRKELLTTASVVAIFALANMYPSQVLADGLGGDGGAGGNNTCGSSCNNAGATGGTGGNGGSGNTGGGGGGGQGGGSGSYTFGLGGYSGGAGQRGFNGSARNGLNGGNGGNGGLGASFGGNGGGGGSGSVGGTFTGITNTGIVTGGAGGNGGNGGNSLGPGGSGGRGGNGGYGAVFQSGAVNSGAVVGGAGGNGGYGSTAGSPNGQGGYGGLGGYGATFSGQGTNSSTGLITGGLNGLDRSSGPGGAREGSGARLYNQSNLTNAGRIAGRDAFGFSGFNIGGYGLIMDNASSLTNSGVISGGYSDNGIGGMGISLSIGSSILNSLTGRIEGGFGKYTNGGAGVSINGNSANLENYGTIIGGDSLFDIVAGTGVKIDQNNGGSIINYGTIKSGVANGCPPSVNCFGEGIAISSSSSLATLTNYGTISGNYRGISNGGIITTLTNRQGGDSTTASQTALTYSGRLPTNYFISIVSTTHYGQLSVTSPTNATTFGIDPNSNSNLEARTYQDVFYGLSDGNFTALTGTSSDGAYSWTLALDNGGYYDLTVVALSYNIAGLSVDVSQTSNTSTSVNSAAALSGAVTVNVANGAAAYLAQRKMTIVSSTGLSGTFSGVTTSQNLSFLTPTLSYDANNVYLTYGLTPFSAVAKNINQRNVGNALTIAALAPVNSLGAPILNALFYGNYENAQSVMDTVGGSGLAGVQSTAMQVGEMASSSVSDQIAFWRSGETMDATGRTSQEGNNPRSFLAYAPVQRNVPAKGPINIKGPAGNLSAAVAPRTFRAWGSMFGGGANYLSDAGRGAAASNIGYYGGLIGVDYQIQPNILVGVALGGSSSNFNVGSLSTNGNLTGFHAGVYGAYTMGNSYIALNETFSAYNNQTSRKAGGYSYLPYEQLSAQFGSTEFRTRAEVGHGVIMGGLKATPFVAAEIAAYQSNAFSEQSSIYASTFALKNNGQGVNSLPTFAGLRLSNAVTLSNGWRLAPVGSVAYVHEFFPQRQFNNILMSMPGTDFNVAGPRSTYNLVQTKVGAQLNLNEKLALFTDFQGEFSPVSQSYGGKGGVKYVW